MSNIIVGFSKPKTWKPFAALIMFGYGIPYDHVFIKFYSKEFDKEVIYQASQLMVNFMGQQFYDENVILDEFEVKLSLKNRKALLQFALDNSGRPYGIKEAIGLGIMRIAKFLGFKINNPLGEKNSYVCSTLVAHILKEYAAIELPEQEDDIDPKELYNYLLQLKNIVKKV